MLAPGLRHARQAPAKLNLQLRVLGRRDDGFHELATLVQTLDLCDEVVVETVARAPDAPAVTLEADGPEAGEDLPRDERNLAVAAALAYLHASDAPGDLGVRIALHKRIPARGGLGGGSADAAAVLRALAELDDAPPEEQRLHDLAAGLGSDLNALLIGGTALALGRGERAFRLPELPPFEVQLALPPFGVSTPAVYAQLDAAPCAPRTPADDDALRAEFEAWCSTASADALPRAFRNDLDTAARRAEPRLAAWLDDGWHLCGSGSTVFRFGSMPHSAPTACESKSIRFLRIGSRKR